MTSFCRLPWQGLDVSPQGEYRPCCKYIDVIATSIDDYKNSPALVKLKDDFSSGIRPPGCNRCWQDEESGIESKRQLEFKEHLHNTAFNDSFKVVSFSFGNICNLACRTCSSYSSSKWTVTANKVMSIFPTQRVFAHTEFYKDSVLLDKFKELSKDAILIEFPGGEPFITGVDQHKDYLRFLIRHDATTKKLHYMTNCTVFPDTEFWDLWKQFKNVDIQLSLDGTGKLAEYIRWPSKWAVTYPIIKKFQNSAGGNIQISISHTLSVLNVYALNNFIQWCADEGLPAPYIGMVSKPVYYDVRNLPDLAKVELSSLLTNDKVLPVKQYMNLPVADITARHLLKQWSYELDKHRSQKLEEMCPELHRFLPST